MQEFIERKIHFYKFEIYTENGTYQKVNAGDKFKEIKKLKYEVGERYLTRGDGNQNTIEVYGISNKVRAKIGIRRITDLPKKETQGKEKPLNLEDGEGLLEAAHFVIFPNGIMGFEFNNYAPRATSLEAYLKKIFPSIVKIDFELLLKDDINHTITRLKNFTEIRLGAYTGGINKFKDWDSNVFEALDNTYQNAQQSQWVEIAMHIDSKDGELNVPFMKKASDFIKKHGDLVRSFKVKGIEKESGLTSDSINLLKDKLLQKKKVAKSDDNTKSVNSIEMFLKIEEAYSEVYDEIQDLL